MQQVRSPLVIFYQGLIIFFTQWGTCIFLWNVNVRYNIGRYILRLGAGVTVVYPIVGIFLRIKTFSDESIPNEGGGYIPISYWIVAMVLGMFTIGRGFQYNFLSQ